MVRYMTIYIRKTRGRRSIIYSLFRKDKGRTTPFGRYKSFARAEEVAKNLANKYDEKIEVI